MTEYLIAVLLAALVNQYMTDKVCEAADGPDRPVPASPFVGLTGGAPLSEGGGRLAVRGAAATLALTLASALGWLAHTALAARGLAYLDTLAFLLVIAASVTAASELTHSISPEFWKESDAVLTVGNAALLGTLLFHVQNGMDFGPCILWGFWTGVGFTVLSLLFAGIRERVESDPDLPKSVKGAPVVLLSAALVSMALMGLVGLF